MNPLVVCVMGGDHAQYLRVCLDAVKDADALIYCDGGSKDNSVAVAQEFGAQILIQKYDFSDPQMNGKQRNFYLDYLKRNHMGSWVLCLDADEIITDYEKLKTFVQTADEHTLYSVHMRHLVRDFGHEDATQQEHYVPNRLFFVSEGLYYPLGKHGVLQDPTSALRKNTAVTTIWHLSYSRMFYLRRRYRENLKFSEIHNKQFLDWWYRAHLFGYYPVKSVAPQELPSALLKHFEIEPDEVYFAGRDLEVKHFAMVQQWNELLHPITVLDLGCGRGPYLSAWNLAGVIVKGVELSRWAAEHPVWGVKTHDIIVGSITDLHEELSLGFDLVTCIDVLEHLDYDQLGPALTNAVSLCEKYLLASIPFLGDPNLDADPTHKIKESRTWWDEQFRKHGLIPMPVPEGWLFREQLLLYKKGGPHGA